MSPERALASWGGGEVVRHLGGGNRNVAIRVHLATGPAVLKSTRHGAASMAWQQKAMALARRAGFRAARLLPTVTGALVHAGWTLETWIEGRPATREELRTLLPLIRRFHRAASYLPPRPHPVPSVPVHPALRRARRAGPLGTIHGDLCPPNVLTAPGLAPGLIDWEEARHDLTVLDLAALGGPATAPTHRLALLAEIEACWRPEPARARRLARHAAALGRGGYR